MKNCIYISKSQKEHDEVEKRKQEYLTQCIREMEQGVFLCLNGICLNDREIQKIFTILDKE
jgi:hypothetical protein